jgi:hypothetical protein
VGHETRFSGVNDDDVANFDVYWTSSNPVANATNTDSPTDPISFDACFLACQGIEGKLYPLGSFHSSRFDHSTPGHSDSLLMVKLQRFRKLAAVPSMLCAVSLMSER